MKLTLEEARILRELVDTIPGLAQAICNCPPKDQSSEFEKAERSYLQRMKDAGFEEQAARRWTSAVMVRLRRQVGDLVEAAKTKRMLKALYEELSRWSQIPQRQRRLN